MMANDRPPLFTSEERAQLERIINDLFEVQKVLRARCGHDSRYDFICPDNFPDYALIPQIAALATYARTYTRMQGWGTVET